MTTALIIAGHGSHLSGQTAAPAWQHAETIRAMGVFDEVTCAFWKEFSSLRRVLDTLIADDITIVPLFTSQGYFSRTVLPSELQLDGPVTQRNGRIIRYADTVGQHPHMTDVVRARVNAILTEYSLDPSQTALALAGHGTKRDRLSAEAVKRQVEAMKQDGKFAEVVSIYMDEPPEIESVYTITQSPSIIIVPFFVADGSHTQEDIPTDLGLSPDPRRLGYSVPTSINGRAVYYTPAVGMEASVANVILELAVAAGTTLKSTRQVQDSWSGFPRAGLDALRQMQLPFEFGQLRIQRNGQEFIVCHKADSSTIETTKIIETPSALRTELSTDVNGNYRALATGVNLPRGWSVRVLTFDALLAVLEVIYPSAWIDTTQWVRGQLPLQSIEQVANRQTGMYKRVNKLPSEQLPMLVQTHCSLCSRTPTWFKGQQDETIATIACPEPCQFFMSFALQQTELQREEKVTLDISTGELESLIAVLERVADAPEPDVRPYEYEGPRNPSRLRALLSYLNEQLNSTSPTEGNEA